MEHPRHGISPWAIFTGNRSEDRGVTLPRGQAEVLGVGMGIQISDTLACSWSQDGHAGSGDSGMRARGPGM